MRIVLVVSVMSLKAMSFIIEKGVCFQAVRGPGLHWGIPALNVCVVCKWGYCLNVVIQTPSQRPLLVVLILALQLFVISTVW